jgi:hypothetical protein
VKPTGNAQPADGDPGQVAPSYGADDGRDQGRDNTQDLGQEVTAAALAWGTTGQPVPPGLTAVPPGLPGTLTEGMLPADPMDLLRAWMDDVVKAGLPEPTAMVLATVSADQRPRARMVLLKGFDSAGFVFYTNRTSRKGQ